MTQVREIDNYVKEKGAEFAKLIKGFIKRVRDVYYEDDQKAKRLQWDFLDFPVVKNKIATSYEFDAVNYERAGVHQGDILKRIINYSGPTEDTDLDQYEKEYEGYGFPCIAGLVLFTDRIDLIRLLLVYGAEIEFPTPVFGANMLHDLIQDPYSTMAAKEIFLCILDVKSCRKLKLDPFQSPTTFPHPVFPNTLNERMVGEYKVPGFTGIYYGVENVPQEVQQPNLDVVRQEEVQELSLDEILAQLRANANKVTV